MMIKPFAPVSSLKCGWRPFERAAFGLIYGAVMVLSLLMAIEVDAGASFRPALILFGSALAMTLARAFAALLSHGIETGERILRIPALSAAWRGSCSILVVAVAPCAFFAFAGSGAMDVKSAIRLSEIFCLAILATVGARVGWVIGKDALLATGGALFASSLGVALSALKYAMQ